MDNKNETKIIGSFEKKNWVSVVRHLTLLFMMIFLFSYVSYAWMRREWTPYIEQQGITISTSGSLVFQLDNQQGGTGMSINKILELDEDFVLKPVSNSTGKSEDFFTLNMAGGEGYEKYQHLKPQTANGSSPDYSSLGIENGYIEFKMALLSPDTNGNTRYIYIHPDSHIDLNSKNPDSPVINCIRVSITIYDQVSAGKTIVFVPDGTPEHNVADGTADGKSTLHSGVNPKKADDGSYVMNGVDYYAQAGNKDNGEAVKVGDDYIVVPLADVKTLQAYMGGYDQDANNGNPTSDNTLFTLSDTDQVWITIRIWAEGSHPDCTEEIAGAQIDLKLKFAAVAVPESQAN